MGYKYIPSDRKYTVYYNDKKMGKFRWCTEGCSGTANRLSEIKKPRFEYRADGKLTGLEKYYHDLGKWATELNTVTHRHRKKLGLKFGFDYLYQNSHFSATTLFFNLLRGDSKFDCKMEPCSPIEMLWYDNCCRSGLLYFDQSVVGSETDGCYGYDFKAHYQSLLVGQALRIPTKQGRLTTVEELPPTSKGLRFGIYRVKISCDHPHVIRVFRFNKLPYYTSREIEHAISLQFAGFPMKIELIIDNEPNALLYNDEDLIQTKSYFRRWYDSISKVIRPSCNNPLVKHLFSALHGCLSQRPKPKRVLITDSEQQEMLENTGYVECGLEATDPDPSKCTFYKLYRKSSARFGIGNRLQLWLTALSRKKVGMTIANHAEHVLRVKTDGFILTKPLEKLPRGLEVLEVDQKYTGKLFFPDSLHRPKKLD